MVSYLQCRAQVAQFAIWQPKEQNLQAFDAGYKKHLQWHKDNGDKWNWYGWYIISGNRVGQFIDATTGHAWADLDKPINPAGDMQDNFINVFPYGNLNTVYKASVIKELSAERKELYTSRFIRMIRFTYNDPVAAKAYLLKFISALKKQGFDQFVTYELCDGNAMELNVLVPFNSNEMLGKLLSAFKQVMMVSNLPFSTIQSETWAYRSDLSLLN